MIYESQLQGRLRAKVTLVEPNRLIYQLLGLTVDDLPFDQYSTVPLSKQVTEVMKDGHLTVTQTCSSQDGAKWIYVRAFTPADALADRWAECTGMITGKVPVMSHKTPWLYGRMVMRCDLDVEAGRIEIEGWMATYPFMGEKISDEDLKARAGQRLEQESADLVHPRREVHQFIPTGNGLYRENPDFGGYKPEGYDRKRNLIDRKVTSGMLHWFRHHQDSPASDRQKEILDKFYESFSDDWRKKNNESLQQEYSYPRLMKEYSADSGIPTKDGLIPWVEFHDAFPKEVTR